MDPDEIIRMLVVDDDPDAADLYRRLLEHSMQVEVSSAVDCATARRKLCDSEYDVVTIDYRLPDESGLVLLEDIAAGEDNPPAIVVTAYGDVHLATRSYELGAAGYVIKDYKLPEKLAAVVQDALAKAALERAGDALNRENAFAGVAVNALEELFFVLDLQGRLTSWNRKLRELTGFSDRELHRMDLADLLTRKESARFMEAVASLERGEKVVLRVRLAAADGTKAPYELAAVMLKDAGETPVGICAIGHRVSWHRRVRKGAALRDDAATGAPPAGPELAELTGEIIARVDFDGAFTYLNDAACRFWGGERRELMGRGFTEFIHPCDLRDGLEAAVQAMRTGRMVKGAVNRQLTPLGERLVEWNFVPLAENGDAVGGLQLTGRDVTEKVATEQLLVRVNRELDAYAHTVSHDLKGPLSAIMLAADTLRALIEKRDASSCSDDTLGEMAGIISRYTEQADSLIEDLLALAESGQVPPQVEEVEVDEVVNAVLRELDARIREKGVAVKVGDGLGRIRGSRAQLFQLFSNLVSNAVVHNDSPEPLVEITRLAAECGCYRYLVRDNGSGIPGEHLDSVFNLFYKGADGGSGVGLATVEKVARVYDGSVRAYNDGGACFEVHLKDLSRGAQAESGGLEPGPGA